MMNSTQDPTGDPTDGIPTDANTSGDYVICLRTCQICLLTCIVENALLFADA